MSTTQFVMRLPRVRCIVMQGSETLGERVVRALGADVDVIMAPSVITATSSSPDWWCSVLVDAGPALSSLQEIAYAHADMPLRPCVLVTAQSQARGAVWPVLDQERIVLAQHVERRLMSAVRRARALGIRAQVGRAATHIELKPTVRRALAYLVRSPRPVRTVAELAVLLHVSRSTLWKAWHESASQSSARLEDVVDWLIVIEAAARKTTSLSWTDIAAQLGLHEHTLSRSAARLADAPLQMLAETPAIILGEEAVRAKVLRFIGVDVQ